MPTVPNSRLSLLAATAVIVRTVVFVACFAVASTSFSQAVFSFPEMLEDAELHDIRFFTPDVGIAVGDRGVILRTEDGGRTWRLVDAPVSCRLNSLSFVDEEIGWAVGGWIQPFTHTSSAVILYTKDSGKRWTVAPSASMPALSSVKFFDEQNGLAIGQASLLFGSGIFRTTDGGRNWLSVPATENLNWLAGDGISPQSGVSLSESGVLGVFTRDEVITLRTETGGRGRAVRVTEQGNDWLVGRQGLIQQSANAGRNWSVPKGASSPVLRAALSFDFRAVDVVDDHVWIAGDPGTSVFHSSDRGKTWERFATGQTAPVNTVRFFDPLRGWAVGALGTILATRDGGRTWRQHRGSSKMALLSLSNSLDNVPLELIARCSGADGYLSAAHVWTVDRSEQGGKIASRMRLNQAVTSAGGSASALEAISNDRNAMVRQVAKLIRQWTPEVVVVDGVDLPSAETALSTPISFSQFVLEAVHDAGDPEKLQDLQNEAGLEPWRPKKVLIGPQAGSGFLTIQPNQFNPRFGRTVSEQVVATRGLIDSQFRSIQPSSYQVFSESIAPELARKDVFSGVALTQGVAGRRNVTTSSITENAGRSQQRQRTIRLLIDRAIEAGETETLIGQLDDLTSSIPPSAAGDMLFSIAGRTAASKTSPKRQMVVAAEVFRYLINRFPDHELVDGAYVWMLHYYGSSEIASKESRVRQVTRPNAIATKKDAKVAPATAVSPIGTSPIGPPSTSASNPISTGAQKLPRPNNASNKEPDRQEFKQETVPTAVPRRLRGVADAQPIPVPVESELAERLNAALGVGKQIDQTRPLLGLEPCVRFPLAAVQRNLRQNTDAIYGSLAGDRSSAAWRELALAEIWLNRRRGSPPKSILSSKPTFDRPKLDGQLDDSCWSKAVSVPIVRERSSPTSVSPPNRVTDEESMSVSVMHDSEFLFLGIRCRKSEGNVANEPRTKRTRDVDLTTTDRVTWSIDIDRDYFTAYQFEVDANGNTIDACVADLSWNPQWYVATANDMVEWRAEVAIPMAELSPTERIGNQPWAISFERLHPKQSASSEVSFVILNFE